MKSKSKHLDVDFIGEQSGLTVQEEKALSEYFAKKKQSKIKRVKADGSKRSKVIA